jgi:heptosyltransferase-2
LLTETVAPRAGVVMMRKRTEAEVKELVKRGVAEPPPPVTAHQMFHYLHLVAALGGKAEPVAPKLEVAETAVAQFVEKFKLGVVSGPWFGLNPMAEYGPAKRWPEERFTEAAIEIQRRTKCRWLIFGLKTDAEMAGRMAANISRAAGAAENAAVSLAGATSLGELCAALKLCRVLLTNDSGPMHVAAALGTPVVALFGSTSPELTGPRLPADKGHEILRGQAECAPCFLRECPIDFRCMTGIGVERVVKAVCNF